MWLLARNTSDGLCRVCARARSGSVGSAWEACPPQVSRLGVGSIVFAGGWVLWVVLEPMDVAAGARDHMLLGAGYLGNSVTASCGPVVHCLQDRYGCRHGCGVGCLVLFRVAETATRAGI